MLSQKKFLKKDLFICILCALVGFCLRVSSTFMQFLYGQKKVLAAPNHNPGTEITDSCELPLGCRELNRDPLQEQLVFLNAGPSLQPPFVVLIRTQAKARASCLVVPCLFKM